MNNDRNPFDITKPIIVFCMVLILIILVSCSKRANADKFESALSSVNDKSFVDNYYKDKDKNTDTKTNTFENSYEGKDNVGKKSENNIYPSEKNFKSEDLANIKNTYYGKYNLDGIDVLGSFEVTRNSIVFTPDNGGSREVIYLTEIRNIDRYDHPNGNIDLSLQFDNYEKIIKNVSDSMFSDILLYTTK